MAFKMSGWSGCKGTGSAMKKTYKAAYETRDKSLYGESMTQEENTAEAKRQKKHFDEHGTWDIPKTKMTGSKTAKPQKATNQPTIVTTDRPGGGTKNVFTHGNYKSVEKFRKDGTVKKDKTDMDITDPDSVKFKYKYRKNKPRYYSLRKKKMISRGPSKQSPSTESDKIDTYKTKYDKEGNVRKEITRTRKKGGTGLGQALKDAVAKRKARRKSKKKERGSGGDGWE